MENVRKDSLGSRGSFEMEGHSGKTGEEYKIQEHGLGGFTGVQWSRGREERHVPENWASSTR